MPAVPFLGPTYTSRSRNVNAQRTINLYPEIDPTGVARNQQAPVAAMYSTPGLRRLSTLPGAGGVRGLYTASDDTLYAVQGEGLYRWTPGEWVLLGILKTTEGPVSMADNGLQLCLVDGDYGYLYVRSTDTFSPITDPDFLGSQKVVYADGYFGFTQPNTQRFYISSLLAGGDLDSLNFASAENLPDPLVTLATNQREVWLLGTQSTEVWYDQGGADFPFTRIQGASQDIGCGAVFSVGNLEGVLFMLGASRQGTRRVYRQNGYGFVPISTHAVETALERMVRIDDAWACTYQQDGHAFYVLTFPTEEQTWCYDLTTGLWHERQSWWPDGVMRGWRVGTVVLWNNLIVGGDRTDGRVYQLDLGVYSEDGDPLVRTRTSPHYVTPELGTTTYHAFELDLETGVGRDAAMVPGTDPQAMLQWSDDGGHTWSHETWASFGVLGDYQARAIWRRLGQARDRIFRVTISDPVKVALIGAVIEATVEGR